MAGRRKRVSVTFAGDDSVAQHIIPINEKLNVLRMRSGRRQSVIEVNDDAEQQEDDDDETVFKPSTALANDDTVTGSDIFRFKSAKRNNLKEKVAEALKKTPSKSDISKSQATTPKSGRKSAVSTPRSSKRISKRLETMTPHRLRARNKDGDTSSEDSASSDSGTDSDDDTDLGIQELTNTPTRKPMSSSEAKIGKKKKTVQQIDSQEDASNYFQSQDLCITSDRTLARLDMPQMDQKTLQSALARHNRPYKKETKALFDQYAALFNKWMFHLGSGYNLLLHGLGSKQKLITAFCDEMLSDFSHLVVNGYFPSITVKSILNLITGDLLEHSGSFRSHLEQCEFIKKHYESGDHEDFFLVVHNIDGSMLRAEKAQSVFSTLSQIRGIHIIASIDHINAPLIWDQAKMCSFRWLWYDVSTFEPYSVETSYENSLLVQQSGGLALSSMTHVVQSLPLNAKKIFTLLVDYQLENENDTHYQGIPFHVLYQKTREAFLVNSDQTLKAQLTEFKDHKLLRTKKGVDGMEYLLIPLNASTLKEFKETEQNE